MFGLHLTLDLYGCNEERLSDEKSIYKILDELPEVLGLHKLTKPMLDSFSDPTPGISGFVIISESHISVHTFAEERFASIDIFSCNKFDTQMATNFIAGILESKKIEKNILTRGIHYPIELRKAIQLNSHQRKKIVSEM